jgi:hypothetical protein
MSLINAGGKRATIPSRFKNMNIWVVHSCEKGGRNTGKDEELAVGGTPAAVAIRSQMIPLRIKTMSN